MGFADLRRNSASAVVTSVSTLAEPAQGQSAGVTNFVINAAGGLSIGTTVDQLAGHAGLWIGDTAIADVVEIVNGIVGQTGNLQEWRVNGVQRALVSAGGAITSGSFIRSTVGTGGVGLWTDNGIIRIGSATTPANVDNYVKQVVSANAPLRVDSLATPAAANLLEVANNGTVLNGFKSDGTLITPPAGAALTSFNPKLGADVAITPINTYVDILTQSLVAGTWLVEGIIQIGQTIADADITGKLYESGTPTQFASQQQHAYFSSAGDFSIHLSTIIVLAATTIVRLAAATTAATTAAKAATLLNTAGNTATQLVAVKIG